MVKGNIFQYDCLNVKKEADTGFYYSFKQSTAKTENVLHGLQFHG